MLLDSLFGPIDWRAILVPDIPHVELLIRGTIAYLALFSLLRLVLRRAAGSMSMTDLLVLVLIADAAQNAMADDYRAIPDGVLLVGVIVFWAFALDWLGYHFKPMERFLHPKPLLLIKDGRMLKQNMKRDLIAHGVAQGARSGVFAKRERGEDRTQRENKRHHLRAIRKPRRA